MIFPRENVFKCISGSHGKYTVIEDKHFKDFVWRIVFKYKRKYYEFFYLPYYGFEVIFDYYEGNDLTEPIKSNILFEDIECLEVCYGQKTIETNS